LLDDLLALALAQRCCFLAHEIEDSLANLGRELCLTADLLERIEVQSIDESPVQVNLELIDRTQLRIRGA